MSKQTISDRIVAQQESSGLKYLGKTTGQYSYRPGSNLMRKLESLGIRPEDAIIFPGAKCSAPARGLSC